MYGTIWRILPGPKWAKALLALLLAHLVAHWRWLVGFFKNGKGERHGK